MTSEYVMQLPGSHEHGAAAGDAPRHGDAVALHAVGTHGLRARQARWFTKLVQ